MELPPLMNAEGLRMTTNYLMCACLTQPRLAEVDYQNLTLIAGLESGNYLNRSCPVIGSAEQGENLCYAGLHTDGASSVAFFVCCDEHDSGGRLLTCVGADGAFLCVDVLYFKDFVYVLFERQGFTGDDVEEGFLVLFTCGCDVKRAVAALLCEGCVEVDKIVHNFSPLIYIVREYHCVWYTVVEWGSCDAKNNILVTA